MKYTLYQNLIEDNISDIFVSYYFIYKIKLNSVFVCVFAQHDSISKFPIFHYPSSSTLNVPSWMQFYSFLISDTISPWVFWEDFTPSINISESSLTIYDLCHLSNELLPKYQQSTVDPRGSFIQLNNRMYPVSFLKRWSH